MTLRARLLGGLGLLVLVAVASSGWLVMRVARLELSTAQETDARTEGEHFLRLLSAAAAESGAPIADGKTRAHLAAIVDEWRIRGVVRDAVIGKDGVAIVGKPLPGDFVGGVASGVIVRREGDALLVFGALSGSGGERAAVRLTLPGEDLIARAVDRSRWLVALAALLCAAAVSLFGTVWVEGVAGRIVALAQAARRVASGDLDGVALPVGESSDELGGLIADFNAMTAALRQQRALVATQAETMMAQEKLATVGRLAAGVAHEIGNPLAAIAGFADMLRSDEHESDPARKLSALDRAQALERIVGEGARIKVIIRELLDYSRPAPETLERVALNDVVERAVSLVRAQPRFREVEVTRDVPSLVVDATPSRLEQIVVNLLLNAADAMQGKGSVRIDASEGERIELAVQDSGPGVAEADRDKIFDPFFSTKAPGQGTGLGLSISLAIAHAGGAELRLEPSVPNRGARFVLSFPKPPR